MSVEWLNIDKKELDYHLNQYVSPKAYTLELLRIFNDYGLEKATNSVLDFGCGGGAVTNLFAQQYPSIVFKGLDINPSYIEIAKSKSHANATYEVFDIYNESDVNRFKSGAVDCLFSFQTISWLKDYEQFLKLLSATNATYSLVTSLFYDGPVEAEIKIKDFTRSMGEINYRETNYNIYSLDMLKTRLQELGYYLEHSIPFEIGFDLPKPIDKSMSTYTESLLSSRRLQISGPLLMSWYTLIIKKINHE